MPFSKVREPVSEVIHGVYAHYRVKEFVIERQAFIYIRQLELSICYIGIDRALAGRFDPLFIDIQPRNATVELLCKIKGWSARTAGYFKDVITCREIEGAKERIVCIYGKQSLMPGGLSILAPAYFCQ